ncbi:MAG: hypothetical protein HQK59_08435 [Deltaproteobacteria bacterium]|nr:hypothetical protein [Deltaproteobacteria bacterium]MBF0523542.1 hypothetical protein [Deltaproteobacteria bacterium]
MKYIKLIILCSIAVVGLVLVLQNHEVLTKPIVINMNLLVLETSFNIPTFIFTLAPFLACVVFMGFFGLKDRIKHRLATKSLEKTIASLKNENNQLTQKLAAAAVQEKRVVAAAATKKQPEVRGSAVAKPF